VPAGFKDREREAIRERLRGAAREALARGGLGAISVADLAKAADIAKGSFYAFYPSKEHLFMEALEEIEDGYRSRFAAAAEGEGTPVERLERAFRAAFELAESEPALRYLDTHATERLARALPPERIAEHAARDACYLEKIAARWREQGVLADGLGAKDIAGAGYAVFLTAMGLASFPREMAVATRDVMARGLALALAAPDGDAAHERNQG
jgi:AcrR family transcriptional regulator